jgi:hypothetical protein
MIVPHEHPAPDISEMVSFFHLENFAKFIFLMTERGASRCRIFEKTFARIESNRIEGLLIE